MIVYVAITLFSSGCRTDVKSNGSECLTDAECVDKKLCVQGVCASVECYDNADCSYGMFCDDKGVCETGCNDEADCPSGEHCVEGMCEPETCDDTQLDCEMGEWCDSGSCLTPDFPNCHSCGFEDWQDTSTGKGDCIIYTFDPNTSCTWPNSDPCPELWSCFPEDGVGEISSGFCVASFWYLYCDPDLACPRGFSCEEILGADEPEVCWADCGYLLGNGFLQVD